MVDKPERPKKTKWKKKTLGSGFGRKLTPEQREKAIKNLKPVKPGEVRNPWGMEKGTVTMAAGLRKILNEVIEFPDPFYVPKKLKKGEPIPEVPMIKMQVAEIINRGLVRNALFGELSSIESIYRKIDGTPDQIIQNNNHDRAATKKEDQDILDILEEGED